MSLVTGYTSYIFLAENEEGNDEEEREEDEWDVCSDVLGVVTDLLVHLNTSTNCCLGEDTSNCNPPALTAPTNHTTSGSGRISAHEGAGRDNTQLPEALLSL